MINRVLRIDERLRDIAKPPLEEIDSIKLLEGDALILCAGFEDRAIELLKRIASTTNDQINIIIYDYRPYVDENRLTEIKCICDIRGIPFHVIGYDRENPANAGDVLWDSIRDIQGRLYIDISGMSRLLIVQILESLHRNKQNYDNVSILYSEAAEYPPSKEEYGKESTGRPPYLAETVMFISSGVFEATLVPELASVVMQGQPIRLISFPSFNTQQLVTLRSEIQPNCYVFIHGIPVLNENKWRTDAIRILNDIDNIPCKEEYYLSTLKYEETLNTLLDLYKKYNCNERILIAPTGSKMQTVAVGLFRAYMKDTQIVYPTPITFLTPEKYTLGVRKIYKLDLDFLQDL